MFVGEGIAFVFRRVTAAAAAAAGRRAAERFFQFGGECESGFQFA